MTTKQVSLFLDLRMDTEISPEQLETNIDDAMSDDGIEAVDVTEKGYKFAPVEVIQQVRISSCATYLPPVQGKVQKRKVAVPQNRFTPLKQAWHQIYKPIVTHMGLEIRMNTKAKAIELRVGRCSAHHINDPQTCSSTKDVGALEKATEYIKAFLVGFELEVCCSEVSGLTFRMPRLCSVWKICILNPSL